MTTTATTETTCADACWSAREQTCRCACGGVNHGVLKGASGERPPRTRRIKGHWYELLAVEVLGGDGQSRSKTTNALWRLSSVVTGRAREARIWKNYDIGEPGYPILILVTSDSNVRNWPELATWRPAMATWRGWRERPYTAWIRQDLRYLAEEAPDED